MNLMEIKGPKDFHMHTTYCDGKNSAEEMVLAAIDGGLKAVGISGHVYTSFDERYCMSLENIVKYHDEIRALAEKYKDKIDVYCGIEQDYFSDYPMDKWDYVIGSVHYIRVPAKGLVAPRADLLGQELGYYEVDDWAYIPVDDGAEILEAAAERYFDGDIYALTAEYFNTVSKVAEDIKPNIIGHFDLVCKFNDKYAVFDENDPRYVAAWKSAADKLLESGVPFEINTGAISRGYKTDPYPSKPIREYIAGKGGKFIWSSDSHSDKTLCFGFE